MGGEGAVAGLQSDVMDAVRLVGLGSECTQVVGESGRGDGGNLIQTGKQGGSITLLCDIPGMTKTTCLSVVNWWYMGV